MSFSGKSCCLAEFDCSKCMQSPSKKVLWGVSFFETQFDIKIYEYILFFEICTALWRYKCVCMLCIVLIEIANRRTYIQYFWVHAPKSLRSYLYVWLNLALRATYVLSDSVDAVQMCLFVCRWAHIQKLPDQTLLKQDQSYFDSMLTHYSYLPT